MSLAHICVTKFSSLKSTWLFLLVFALLLMEHVTFLTSHGEADDQGKELFKVQLIIFVVVQVLQDTVHSFGVLLSLKEHYERRQMLRERYNHQCWWGSDLLGDRGSSLSGRWAARSPSVSSAPFCSRSCGHYLRWHTGGRSWSRIPCTSPVQSWLQRAALKRLKTSSQAFRKEMGRLLCSRQEQEFSFRKKNAQILKLLNCFIFLYCEQLVFICRLLYPHCRLIINVS